MILKYTFWLIKVKNDVIMILKCTFLIDESEKNIRTLKYSFRLKVKK